VFLRSEDDVASLFELVPTHKLVPLHVRAVGFSHELVLDE